MSQRKRRRSSERRTAGFGKAVEERLDRVQDHALGADRVDRVLEADEEALEVVLAGLLDLAALDAHVVDERASSAPRALGGRTRARRRWRRAPRAVSSNDMNTPGSPCSVAPRTRNSIAKSVLPQPAPPHTSVGRPRGSPPPVISSRPWIPEGDLGRFSSPRPGSAAREAAIARPFFLEALGIVLSIVSGPCKSTVKAGDPPHVQTGDGRKLEPAAAHLRRPAHVGHHVSGTPTSPYQQSGFHDGRARRRPPAAAVVRPGEGRAPAGLFPAPRVRKGACPTSSASHCPTARPRKRRRAPSSPTSCALQIGAGLAKAAYFAKLDGVPVDLARPLDRDAKLEVVTTKSPEALEVARHDAAHVMASAVQRLFPGTQVTIGPAIEDGFYYDFVAGEGLHPRRPREDRDRRSHEEIKADLPVRREEVSMDDALALFEAKGEKFKVEIVEDIAPRARRRSRSTGTATGSTSASGRTARRPAGSASVKLMNVAGAYWRGDRTQPDAAAHLRHRVLRQEAARRVPARASRRRRSATTASSARSSSCSRSTRTRRARAFWLPHGHDRSTTRCSDAMRRLVHDERLPGGEDAAALQQAALGDERPLGQVPGEHVPRPRLRGGRELPPRSAHFSLKPMNCPSHHLIYGMRRSAATASCRCALHTQDVLHRNEAIGRARRASPACASSSRTTRTSTCMESQIADEVARIVELIEAGLRRRSG